MSQLKRVLLLTSVPLDRLDSIGSSLVLLPAALKQGGACLQFKCWKDADITSAIDQCDVISVLWCDEYNQCGSEFLGFLDLLEKKLACCEPGPKTVNSISLIKWNIEKHYLLDLQNAGIDIPRTEFVDTDYSSIHDWQQRLQEFKPRGPIVIKPAISALAQNTGLIRDASMLTEDDIGFLQGSKPTALGASLMLQEFQPGVLGGEYSFIFIKNELVNVFQKIPKQGDFRCTTVHGGSISCIDKGNLSKETLDSVQCILDFMIEKFGAESVGYVRIDGVVSEHSPFVVMEVEAIEPELWLEYGGIEELVHLILD